MKVEETSIGDSEDPLERHIHVSDNAIDIVSPVCPGVGERRTDKRIARNARTTPGMIHPVVLRVASRIKKDQHDAEKLVPEIGNNRAIDKLVKVDQHVDDHRHTEKSKDEVIPEDPVLEPLAGREDQEGQKEDEHHVDPS